MARMPTLLDLTQMDRNRGQARAMDEFFNATQMPMAPQPAMPAAQPARPLVAAPAAPPAPAPAPERRGLLGGFFGPEGRDARARLAIALEGMTMRPNEALIGELQRGIESRETERQQNKTLEWLASLGTPQAQRALQYAEATGDVIGATKMALEQAPQADPLAAIQLEKARIELERLKAGAGMDPNVQASAPLPDQSGVVLTMRDGTVQVRTVGGEVVTGQAALDFVRNAQENAAEYQRSIYGARREGTLGADIGLGEEAAAASARGTELGRAQGAAIAGAPTDIATADTTLQYIQEVRQHPGLDIGTGATSAANILPGTPGYDFQNRVNQLLSGGFLTAIDQLRGMGALSNAEGQTAREAITRMDTATSRGAFLDALADYEEIVRAARERAERRIQQPATEQPAPAAPTGGRIRYDENGNRIQ